MLTAAMFAVCLLGVLTIGSVAAIAQEKAPEKALDSGVELAYTNVYAKVMPCPGQPRSS